jgi:hypothetical protein
MMDAGRRCRTSATAPPETIDRISTATYTQRCLFALARTRVSNTALRIGVCAVWNGFSIVCGCAVNGTYDFRSGSKRVLPYLTLTYSSQTSVKNALMPSSFFASCRSMNFISVHS